jgi:hypothetical protein
MRFSLNVAFTVLLLEPDPNSEEKHMHTDLDLVNQHNKKFWIPSVPDQQHWIFIVNTYLYVFLGIIFFLIRQAGESPGVRVTSLYWPAKIHNSLLFFKVPVVLCTQQCRGSVTAWYGSGSVSSDPYLWLTDPDGDPGWPKTYGSYGPGCGFGTLVYLHHSSKIKSHQEVTKQ